MLNDAIRNLGDIFNYQVINCESIPFINNYFDVVIANHVLFYLDDLFNGLSEIERILKNKGAFVCSTYGKKHMKEIDELVRRFDPSICLSRNNLYDIFGKENRYDLLNPFFNSIEWIQY